MEDERHVLPAVRLICESYVTFCRSKPWQEACASSLTELFAPKIHQQRIEAFPRHYPWIPPEGLDYFKSRLVQAPRDVNHGLRIVRTWAVTPERQQRGFEGVGVKLGMVWGVIEAIPNTDPEERGGGSGPTPLPPPRGPPRRATIPRRRRRR